jgi:hypothetical protein
MRVTTSSTLSQRPSLVLWMPMATTSLGSQDIVSGDYGRVSLNAYAYDQAGNKGVSYGLNNIMLLAKGDSLGGAKPSAASDFGVVAGKAPAAESVDSDW